MNKLCYLTALVLFPSSAWALVPPDYKEPPSDIYAEIEAGLQVNSGNNSTQNFNGRTHITYDTEKAKQEATFKAYYAADDGSSTAEKFDLYLQSNYKFDDAYLYGRGELTWDKFGSFTRISTISTGYGFDVISDSKHTLSLEMGPGYRYDIPIATESEPDPSANSNVILRSAAKYSLKLQEYTSFNADFTAEAGKDNSTLTLDLSYKNTFIQDWAFKVGMNFKYNTTVPTDTKQLDTITTFNLLYTYQ
ncbi:DUF481 domain-containing protein [Shewanella sp. WXL01]|uniref:DUF481 domain-containing protein n=1 Tax=Shewanella maritima TaxID=2520507 RepID=A0A411PG46_9GAMM|nr:MULTISPECIES: DUF481 domain-containing protein [Shewanella]NKF49460.1 DUF481 domain-containing protein [Shewanella sp. WXL01]QBF82434.1 DUF481 domain-containing protein [Shewanella maritima]